MSCAQNHSKIGTRTLAVAGTGLYPEFHVHIYLACPPGACQARQGHAVFSGLCGFNSKSLLLWVDSCLANTQLRDLTV